MRIVFAGSIGRFPVGGHAWVDLQYLLGLRAAGHDVFYLEECGSESLVYHWRRQELTNELEYPAGYVRSALAPFGFGERWIYRAGDQAAGASPQDFVDFCRGADLLLIRAIAIPLWRSEYDAPRRRAFIDMDPLFTQIKLARGQRDLVETVGRCNRLFTIGQRLGEPDCPAPAVGREWHKTLPPVCVEEWPFAAGGEANCLTCVLQWRSYRDVEYQGVHYGNKDREFPRFIELPRRVKQPLRLAVTGANAESLRRQGWQVTEGWRVSESIEAYRNFIQASRGEFSVAKHGYVTSRCGWISDRTVCYLASGRPAVVQDTGLADWLPLGRGVLAFDDPDSAVTSIEALNADYEGHRRAARRIAEDFFDARRVLPVLLETAMN